MIIMHMPSSACCDHYVTHPLPAQLDELLDILKEELSERSLISKFVGRSHGGLTKLTGGEGALLCACLASLRRGSGTGMPAHAA